MPEIIEGGPVRTSPLRIEGPAWNGARILGQRFAGISGPAIWIGGCEDVRIEGLDADGVDEGIHFGIDDDTQDVYIGGFTIRNARGDAIQIGARGSVRHPGLVVENGLIDGAGTGSTDGSKHGVYDQAGALLQRIVVLNSSGNGFSCRRGSRVLDCYADGTDKAGICYFPDHQADPDTEFLAERNFVANWGRRFSYGGIDLELSGTASLAEAVARFILRDNIAGPGTRPLEIATGFRSRVTVNTGNRQLAVGEPFPPRPGLPAPPVEPPVEPPVTPPALCLSEAELETVLAGLARVDGTLDSAEAALAVARTAARELRALFPDAGL